MAKNFCSQCGASVVAGLTFCPQCGHRLAGVAAAPAAPSAVRDSSPDVSTKRDQAPVSWGLLGGLLAVCVLFVVGFVVFNGLSSHGPSANASANTGKSVPGSGAASALRASTIHDVDFMNRTYESECAKNVDPVFGNAVTVSNGQWVTKRGVEQFGFRVVKVAYADLNSDGQDEAVVEISCYRPANWDYRQVYVFAASPKGPQLRATAGQDVLGLDSISDVGIENARIAITTPEGGFHVCPEWNTTYGFRLNGDQLVRDGVLHRIQPDCNRTLPGRQPAREQPNAPKPDMPPSGMAPQNAAGGTVLTAAQIAAVNDLVIRNGGLDVTVPAFVNGTRRDGLNLHSTVAQMYAGDVPPILASLFRKYNVPTTDTIEQGFLVLYVATTAQGSGSRAPVGTTLTLEAQLADARTRTVVVKGVDTGQPTGPYSIDWGDGTSALAYFPQTKVYRDAAPTRITVTATYPGGLRTITTLDLRWK